MDILLTRTRPATRCPSGALAFQSAPPPSSERGSQPDAKSETAGPEISIQMTQPRSKLGSWPAFACFLAAACGDATGPGVEGAIGGRVVIEGAGLEGASVDLEPGEDTETGADGRFEFPNVSRGEYVITISDLPDDAVFDRASATVEVSLPGESPFVVFDGRYIRTSLIMGLVQVDGLGVSDIALSLSGVEEREAETEEMGAYAFPNLRAGDYEIRLSQVDSTRHVFDASTAEVELDSGEVAIVHFRGKPVS